MLRPVYTPLLFDKATTALCYIGALQDIDMAFWWHYKAGFNMVLLYCYDIKSYIIVDMTWSTKWLDWADAPALWRLAHGKNHLVGVGSFNVLGSWLKTIKVFGTVAHTVRRWHLLHQRKFDFLFWYCNRMGQFSEWKCGWGGAIVDRVKVDLIIDHAAFYENLSIR